jgi:hypothetical protein
MEANDVCVLLDRIAQLKKIGLFSNADLKKKFTEDYIDFFVKKLIELHRRRSEPSNSLLIKTIQNQKELEIQDEEFENVLINYLSIKSQKQLGVVLDSFEHLQDVHKRKLMKQLLIKIKQKEVNIKSLSINQLAQFIIQLCSKISHQTEILPGSDLSISDAELVPYIAYLNKLLKKENDHQLNINMFSELMFSLAKEGYINTEDEAPPLYYHYMHKLCESWDHLDHDHYPKVLWTLAITEQKDLPNPLIPIMFEKLPEIELSKPLSDEDSAYFYQFILFVKEKVKQNVYPPSFEELVSENVVKVARKKYIDFDKCLHTDTQREIGKL